MNRIEEESMILKNKKEWILAEPGLSFQGGLADIVVTLQLDAGTSYTLDLIITRRLDINKTNILLAYSNEAMGLVNLPPTTLVHMAKRHSAVTSYANYKEPVPAKKSRQS
jgi:hypothetical protein